MKPTYGQVAPSALSPHPRNASIYGSEDVSELIELIHQSRWVKPIVVTPNHTIISGHRRWKAVCLLKWETVSVEYREFADSTAELEALLLGNTSRFKTVEQKVREAEAWKEVEAQRARERQRQAALSTNQKLRRETDETLCENFRTASKTKGRTVDLLAARVGLGSGRTYEKAAKVVKAIELEISLGNLETASTLRNVLNSKSVDAAYQLLPSTTKPLNPGRSSNNTALSNTAYPKRSCWNCQYRGELIENHSFSCARLGTLSLLDKDADTRGAECDLWCTRQSQTIGEANPNTQPTNYTLTLSFSAQLRPLLEDAARSAGMSVVDWAHRHLLQAALVNRPCPSNRQELTSSIPPTQGC